MKTNLSVTEPDSQSLSGLRRHEELAVAAEDECPEVGAVVGPAERAALSLSQLSLDDHPCCSAGVDVEGSVVYAVNRHGSSKGR